MSLLRAGLLIPYVRTPESNKGIVRYGPILSILSVTRDRSMTPASAHACLPVGASSCSKIWERSDQSISNHYVVKSWISKARL